MVSGQQLSGEEQTFSKYEFWQGTGLNSAEAIVAALRITLLGEAPKARETDPEAYELYLEGQFFGYQRTSESIGKAIELFKSALEIDPGYARAYLALAITPQTMANSPA